MRGRAGGGLIVLLVLLASACGNGSEDLSGSDLVAEIGCFACHGPTNTARAPTLDGLWGSEVLLEDGRTVVADEEYVRRAITDPQAEIAAGFESRMPTFDLSETEVDRLIDYVRSLG